ncbi:MAG: hypothetical protein K5893_05195 [Prevotella sp.]|nr:hypothetical protein [Prevotella sp.]
MTIVEQQTIGKHSQETNEDGIIIATDFIAVVDGSTSKSPFQIHQGMSNGRYAMLLVKQVVEQLPAEVSLSELCQRLTEAFSNVYRDNSISMSSLEEHPETRLTASAAIFSRHLRQIWLIGDCQCLIDAKGETISNPKPAEEGNALRRSEYIKQALAKGERTEHFQQQDNGRKLIIPAIIESCKGQNKDFAVIDGFPISLKHVKIVDCQQASEIVMSSDGYPVLKPTLKETEAFLAELLKKDPLCIDDYKATKGLMAGNKSFDDRSYIRFRP